MLRKVMCVIAASLLSVQAWAGAYVADTARFEILSESVEVRAGHFLDQPLNVQPGDIVEVRVQVNNQTYDDLNAYLCSGTGVQLFKAKQSSDCRGITRGRRNFNFQQAVTSASNHLILDNSFSLIVKKKVQFSVSVVRRIPDNVRDEMTRGLDELSDKIRSAFKVQPFDLRVEPCGTQNAFSSPRSGDITICSELMIDLMRRRLNGALNGVVYHELGHTLLNLWQLPGWDNEETCDEFALVMLYWGGKQEQALEWIKYFANKDPRAEALYKIRNDDRHPLSVQRIRNVERILANPAPVIQRWNKLLYPKMTESGLRTVLATNPLYADRKLAQDILAQR